MIEMIGVLSVIAILASMIVPKVFESMATAKINATAANFNAIKTALLDHFSRYGGFAVSNGVALSVSSGTVIFGFDSVLMSEGLLEKKFETRLGSGYSILMRGVQTGGTAVTGNNSAYWLSGTGSSSNEVSVGTAVVECAITNVAIQDAVTLNDRIDGPDDSSPTDVTVADLMGRVKYAIPTNGVTSVFLYLGHR